MRSQAYMRAALNIGFTLGAADRRHRARVQQRRHRPRRAALHRGVLALNAFYITRLPDAQHDKAPVAARTSWLNPGALRNRGFLS